MLFDEGKIFLATSLVAPSLLLFLVKYFCWVFVMLKLVHDSEPFL